VGCVIAEYCALLPPPCRRFAVTRSVAQLVTAVQRGPRASAGAQANNPAGGKAYSGLCSGRVEAVGGQARLAWIAGSCTAERCDPRQANPVEAADQPGSRECLGIAGGRWVVEFVVAIVVVRQNRGEAFGACDGSGWRMGRRSGACVVGVVRHTLPIMTRRHPCCRYRLACFVQCWSIDF
jgi:hypothetical protein